MKGARRLRVFAAALALGVCAGGSASGQEPADPDLSTEGMRRLGPLHVRPYVLLKNVGYDDNVRFDASRSQGDYTATLAPGFQALLLASDRGGVLVSEEAAYVAFRDDTSLNHWNNSARARGVLLLRHAALSLEDRHDTVLERPNTEIDRRIRRDNNAATAGFRALSAGRLGLRAYLKDERIDYASGDPLDDEIASRLNRRERTLSLIGEARVLPKTTLTLQTDLGNVDFDDPAEPRDSRTRSAIPGLRFDPSASVQGEIRAGVTRLHTIQRSGQSYTGAVGDGRLTARLGPAGRAKLAFGRGLVFSTDFDNVYYVSSTWSAAYEQFFSRKSSAEVLYGKGLNHYLQPVLPAASVGDPLDRNDRLTTYQLQLRYRLNPRLAITAGAQRFVRDSTLGSLDRDRNAFFFGSTYDL